MQPRVLDLCHPGRAIDQDRRAARQIGRKLGRHGISNQSDGLSVEIDRQNQQVGGGDGPKEGSVVGDRVVQSYGRRDFQAAAE